MLTELLLWADAGSRPLLELNVRSASLEDVFLDVATSTGGQS